MCSAPDLQEIPSNFGIFFLGSVFHARLKPDVQTLLGTFIRRIEHAAEEYRNGVASLRHYVELLPQTNNHTRHYRQALSHFETCILHAHTAILLLKSIGLAAGAPPMLRNYVGTDYDRLRELNNRIKHFDEDVIEKDGSAKPGFPIAPIWITDNGLEGFDKARNAVPLSFVELHGIVEWPLTDARSLAEQISGNNSDA